MIVDTDLIRDSSMSMDPYRWTIDRTFVVRDMPVSTNGPDPHVYKMAISCSGIPRWNETHPDYPFMLARHFKLASLDGKAHNAVEVVVTYEWERPEFENETELVIETSTTSRQVQTDIDIDGGQGTPKQISVSYWPLQPSFDGTEKGDALAKHALTDKSLPAHGIINVYRPLLTKTWTKTLTSSAKAIEIADASVDYVDCVNEAAWQGGEPRTWLCNAVDVSARPYRGRYVARVTCIWRPETWDEFAQYVSPDRGYLPNLRRHDSDALKNNGFKRVKPYQTKDLQGILDMLSGGSSGALL